MLHNYTMNSSPSIVKSHNTKVEERRQRVVSATTELAIEGGMAAVRSRAICQKAGVSMGTLYRDFSSLEEILLIGFAEQFRNFGAQFPNGVAPGDSAIERIETFFTAATHAMTTEANYGRAAVSAIAAGQSKAMGSLVELTLLITRLVQSAWTGIPAMVHGSVTERDVLIAFTLERVWFSVLVGWASEIQSPESVVQEVVATARLFLAQSD